MRSTTSTRRKGKAPLARYVNYFEIGHNAFEFVVDAGQIEPDSGDILLHSRFALGPTHAKLLAHLLADAVARFEADNGVIASIEDDDDPAEAILASLPDFERRAVAARLQPAAVNGARSPFDQER